MQRRTLDLAVIVEALGPGRFPDLGPADPARLADFLPRRRRGHSRQVSETSREVDPATGETVVGLRLVDEPASKPEPETEAGEGTWPRLLPEHAPVRLVGVAFRVPELLHDAHDQAGELLPIAEAVKDYLPPSPKRPELFLAGVRHVRDFGTGQSIIVYAIAEVPNESQ